MGRGKSNTRSEQGKCPQLLPSPGSSVVTSHELLVSYGLPFLVGANLGCLLLILGLETGVLVFYCRVLE